MRCRGFRYDVHSRSGSVIVCSHGCSPHFIAVSTRGALGKVPWSKTAGTGGPAYTSWLMYAKMPHMMRRAVRLRCGECCWDGWAGLGTVEVGSVMGIGVCGTFPRSNVYRNLDRLFLHVDRYSALSGHNGNLNGDYPKR